MKYLIQDMDALAPGLKAWSRNPRVKAKVHADFRHNGEVRLAPISYSPTATAQLGDDGCTLHVQMGFLLVACCKACGWIEDAVCRFLADEKIIARGIEVVECPVIPRQFPRPQSLARSAPVPSVSRRIKKVMLSVVKQRRVASVLEAVEAAARDAGSSLVVTDRALRSAAVSDYNDPDYIYAALMALALAAKTNAAGSGLGMPWTAFLASNGSHDYSPHSSSTTLQRFRKDYVVVHDGVEYLVEAHLCCGTGSGSDSARIYVAQPARPGQPVIVGHVGSHLPIHTRSH
ncbi:MAG: hypothetical protein ACKOCD_02625 [Nitrospiraceae bacterium]